MRILFLTHRLPYAPNRGDRIRAYYLLQEMARFAEVDLFSLLHDADETSRLHQVPFARHVDGVRVTKVTNVIRAGLRLGSGRPITHSLLDASHAKPVLARMVVESPPDIVVAYCSGMARFAVQPPLATYPLVLDMVDVDSVKWRQLAGQTRRPLRWILNRESSTLQIFEAHATHRAGATLVVNERERDALRQIVPDANVVVLENGIDVASFAPDCPPAREPVVIFCGVMNYEPNEEGVTWFAREVWPRVLFRHPAARFMIVGAHPTPHIRKLARDRSIEVVGAVDRIQPYLWRAAVSVAPLRIARGLQNKVLEALAAGLPVIVTPIVFDGLPAPARSGCLAANDATAFAEEVVNILRWRPEERRARALGAQLQSLTWPIQLARIESVLRNVYASFHSRTA